MITARSSLADISFAVCTALQQGGVTAVLTGGSAATYYAPQQYVSRDADFIIAFQTSDADIVALMSGLGFDNRYGVYVHKESPYTVEFPSGPLAIGRELIKSWETVRRSEQLLHVLTRTDSVRDRLAGYLFWNDLQSLSAASAVASSGPIDLETIRRWIQAEGHAARLDGILGALPQSY